MILRRYVSNTVGVSPSPAGNQLNGLVVNDFNNDPKLNQVGESLTAMITLT
jgi:hypothetical protein